MKGFLLSLRPFNAPPEGPLLPSGSAMPPHTVPKQFQSLCRASPPQKFPHQCPRWPPTDAYDLKNPLPPPHDLSHSLTLLPMSWRLVHPYLVSPSATIPQQCPSSLLPSVSFTPPPISVLSGTCHGPHVPVPNILQQEVFMWPGKTHSEVRKLIMGHSVRNCSYLTSSRHQRLCGE